MSRKPDGATSSFSYERAWRATAVPMLRGNRLGMRFAQQLAPGCSTRLASRVRHPSWSRRSTTTGRPDGLRPRTSDDTVAMSPGTPQGTGMSGCLYTGMSSFPETNPHPMPATAAFRW